MENVIRDLLGYFEKDGKTFELKLPYSWPADTDDLLHIRAKVSYSENTFLAIKGFCEGLIILNGELIGSVDPNHPFTPLPGSENSADLELVLSRVHLDHWLSQNPLFCFTYKRNVIEKIEVISREELKEIMETNIHRNFRPRKLEFDTKFIFVGHSHIDLAWLWDFETTYRKMVGTSLNVLNLMKEFPEFKFSQTQAQIYEWLENRNQDLFVKIKKVIKEKKWIPTGGMWVEPDMNIPGLESIIRQAYYGKKYFKERFDVEVKVCWLPDTFGFNGNLPQILKKCGFEYFGTAKLNANDTTVFPYVFFLWEGIDGTKIRSYHAPDFYNGVPRFFPDLNVFWRESRVKQKVLCLIFTYGYGDGGGGPTYEMLETLRRLREKSPDRVEITDLEIAFSQSFESLKEKLPVYKGELYFQNHRGTYTSVSKIKAWNRYLEGLLKVSEALNTVENLKREEDIERCWKVLLRYQFHDVIAGTCIPSVYEKVFQDFNSIEGTLKSIIDEFKSQNSSNSFFHPDLSSSVRTIILRTHENAVKFHGKVYHLQEINETRKICLLKDVNGVGWHSFEFVKEDIGEKPWYELKENSYENKFIKVLLNGNGTIKSFYHKEMKYDFVKDKWNIFQVFTEKETVWDAWDISRETILGDPEIFTLHDVRKGDEGSVFCDLKLSFKYGNSTIDEILRFYHDRDFVDLILRIDWNEKSKLLKLAFPINMDTPEVLYEIPGGFIKRSNRLNYKEDPHFEVPGQRWIALWDGKKGVGIVNDSKYGYDCNDSNLRVTLLRSPMWPAERIDIGIHSVKLRIVPLGNTIAPLYSHSRDLVEEVVTSQDKKEIILKVLKGVLEVSSIFPLNEGMGIRLYEPLGREQEVSLELKKEVKSIFITDDFESYAKRERVNYDEKNRYITLHFMPFEIRTLILTR